MWMAGLLRVRRIEGRLEAVRVAHLEVEVVHQVVDRRQHDLRRERERRDHRPRGHGAVVRPVGNAAPEVVEEGTFDAIELEGRRSRPIAGRDPPAVLSISYKFTWVLDRIALLHISCATAVLEIIDTFIPHERVLDSTKIDPDVRKLVGE